MNDALADIEAYKRQLDIVTDAELASVIGYQRSTIAQWKKRGGIPASAKRTIERHIGSRKTNEAARASFSKLSASKRQFSKAIVVRYLVETTLDEDGDLEPDGLLYRAIEMDKFEMAAARLLDHELAAGAKDMAAAYRNVLATDVMMRLATELTAMQADL